MSDATARAPSFASPTIRPDEAAHFGAQAAEWWDPKGSSAMLHRLNPVRLGFVRNMVDRHWGTRDDAKPLVGKRALDVGCGAGLLTEPLARLGAKATGVDAAPESIAVAKAHAEAMELLAPLPSGEGPGEGERVADARLPLGRGTPPPNHPPSGGGLSGVF